MSSFIDKLTQLSQAESQPIGFGVKQVASARPRIQLVASLAQGDAGNLIDYVAGADAALLSITKVSSGIKALQKASQAVSDIPWGGWLTVSGPGEIKQMVKAGGDFVVFPATDTPLSILQNDEVGKVLAVEASLGEGLLRAANELPVDAVLVVTESGKDYFLTWQHLMLFRRFADLLVKPLLVSVPSTVTSAELQALWEAGVDGVVTEVSAEQPQDRLKELRQVIDNLVFPSSHKREKIASLLSPASRELSAVSEEEEEEDF